MIPDSPFAVMSVLGPLAPQQLGLTDAHTHLWIEALAGNAPGSPVLADRAGIVSELISYRRAGGGAVIDCQPAGCGRNAAMLVELSRESGVGVVACTGYHRPRYYPTGDPRWEMSATQWRDQALTDLNIGMAETLAGGSPARAGFVKAACEASLAATPQAALEGMISAAVSAGAALLVHTEQGQSVEAFLSFCGQNGLAADRLIFCHIDKRPDFGLHRELAEAGVLLEYDTFYRPRYDPERNLWPLIAKMAHAGLADRVALATDMAETALWRFSGGAPGLPGLLNLIYPRLIEMGIAPLAIAQMTGGNIANRLARCVS